MLTLKAALRDKSHAPAILLKNGLIPAVFYGKQTPSTPVAISETDFKKVWKQGGESSVVTLVTPTGEHESLIHEVDLDPVTNRPRHADFYVFEKGHKVEVEVPIEFVGTSAAVKDLGGVLVKVVHALKVEAMPKDLPHSLEIDISSLVTFENQIVAQDIILPAGIVLKVAPDEVIALVSAPREEREEAPVDLSTIEVLAKGKEEVVEEATPESTPNK